MATALNQSLCGCTEPWRIHQQIVTYYTAVPERSLGHQHSPHYLGLEGRQNTMTAHPKIDAARRANVCAATDLHSEEATVRRIVTVLLVVAIAIGVASVLVLITHPHVLTNPSIFTTSIPATT
jgi:hypothetical protein